MMPSRSLKLVSLSAVFVLGAMAAVACGSDERAKAYVGGDRPLPASNTGQPCNEGATGDCHVTLNERNGILTCAQGSQICVDGYWSTCEGATVSEQAVPAWVRAAGGVRPLALSAPADCDPENLCDPACQQFDEQPDAGLIPPLDGGSASGTFDWQWGSLADFPGGHVDKQLREPCHSGADCQFNMYCEYPDNGSCAHSMCEDGEALAASCDSGDSEFSCVDMICDIDATCCEGGGAGGPAACAHDPCIVGAGLDDGDGVAADACDPCVATICITNGHDCCDNNPGWTQACVDLVATLCGNTCGCETGYSYNADTGNCYFRSSTADDWSGARNACLDLQLDSENVDYDIVAVGDVDENDWLYTAFGSGGDSWIGAKTGKSKSDIVWQDASGAALGFTGTWESGSGGLVDGHAAYLAGGKGGNWGSTTTGTEKNYICEGSPTKMSGGAGSGAWTDTCVGLVADVCGSYCDTTNMPPLETGTCQQWQPGDTDPSCASFDVSAAPTCERDGVPIIPVCNHGTVQAPAGLPIISFQGASEQDWKDYQLKCNPTFDDSDFADTCVTTEVIPPGECIEVTGCDLDNNGAIVVNPIITIDIGGTPVTGDASECNCLGNWTLVHPRPSCGDPTCGSADGFIPELITDCTAPLPDAEYDDNLRTLLTHVWSDGDDVTVEDPVTLFYTGSEADCDDVSWYFDDPTSPTAFVLCPDLCDRVQDATLASSRIWVELSCTTPPTYQQQSHDFTYQGDCGVNTDRGVQWADLGWDANIPVGTSIVWEVAAAASLDDLPPNAEPTWKPLGTSTATMDVCPVNAAGSCAFDIFDALDMPDAQLEYLAVRITLVPNVNGTRAPTLNDWDITYACPFNQ